MPAKKNDILERLENKFDSFKERFDEHVMNENRVESKVDLIKEHIEQHMSTITAKMEKFDERLDKIDVLGVKNSAILDEHVRRTDLLEKKLDVDKNKLEGDIKSFEKKYDDDMSPLKAQQNQFKVVMKVMIGIIVAAGAAGGGAVGLKKILELFLGG